MSFTQLGLLALLSFCTPNLSSLNCFKSIFTKHISAQFVAMIAWIYFSELRTIVFNHPQIYVLAKQVLRSVAKHATLAAQFSLTEAWKREDSERTARHGDVSKLKQTNIFATNRSRNHKNRKHSFRQATLSSAHTTKFSTELTCNTHYRLILNMTYQMTVKFLQHAAVCK